jgi:two-component system sensor histidine kinase QseC
VHSLRRRLTWVLSAGLAVLLGGSALALERLVRAQATEEFDAALLARARALAALTEEEGGRIELDYVPQQMPEFEREERPDHFQFWLEDGTPLLRSRRLTHDLPRPSRGPTPAFLDAPLPGARVGRAAQLAFVPRSAAPTGAEARSVLLTVARGREPLDAFVARTRASVLGVAAVALLLGLLWVHRALASGFRPIDRIAAQVRALDADRLRTEVDVPGTPAELAPVVEQLNALLARLRASFERERRFTGNVAHELRTPIAELRSLADVAARWPDDATAVAGFFADVRAVAGRMEGLVADLLLLARCQAGVERVVRTPTSLRDTVLSAWGPLAADAARAGLRFQEEIDDDLVVESDPDRLAIVVGNLLRNAVAHARPGTRVRCTGRRVDGTFRLDVRNAADPLTADEMGRLGEPFWRRDEARSRDGHAGLGLALVTAVSGVLGIAVRFEQEDDGTFLARLSGRALDRSGTAPDPEPRSANPQGSRAG